MLRIIPTTAGNVDFVRVMTYPEASPQVEAGLKNEGSMTFDSESERIRTLASTIPISTQALQDLPGLEEAINVQRGSLYDEEDDQILLGDNTGENFHGLLSQATAFNTALLVPTDGYEYIDLIARSIQQLQTAKANATGIVIHPSVWWSMVLSKDSQGRYILGDPAQMTETRLWGLPVSVSTAITATKFLVGDFQTGAALWMRMEAVIEAGTINDQFVRNMITLRIEERGALVTYKPTSFVTGTFAQSPA